MREEGRQAARERACSRWSGAWRGSHCACVALSSLRKLRLHEIRSLGCLGRECSLLHRRGSVFEKVSPTELHYQPLTETLAMVTKENMPPIHHSEIEELGRSPAFSGLLHVSVATAPQI